MKGGRWEAIILLQSSIPFIKGFFVSQLLRSLASIQQMSNKLQFDLVVAGNWKREVTIVWMPQSLEANNGICIVSGCSQMNLENHQYVSVIQTNVSASNL